MSCGNESLFEMNKSSLGGFGSVFTDGIGAIAPATDFYFWCIVPNEDIVVNTMTVDSDWADYSGKTLAKGIPIYTNCSSITLTSGSATYYQRASDS